MSAQARLRQTFKYPSEHEDSDGDSRAEMDEQEQETLVSGLREAENASNAWYVLGFTALPIAVSLVFWYHLLGRSAAVPGVLCLLAITSLMASALMMVFVPLGAGMERGEQDGVDAWLKGLRRSLAGVIEEGGPIQTFVPYLNAGICGLLAVAAWVVRRKSEGVEGSWVLLLLPGVMLGMVVVARRSIVEVDSGIRELDWMRYRYKGA